MDSSPSSKPVPVTDDELHALVDGRVPPGQRQALEARLAQDPDASATRQDWQRQRDALKSLHRRVLDEPVPAALLAAARRADDGRGRRDQWSRWGGMAASLVLAFGLGWGLHAQWGAGAQSAVSRLAQGTGGAAEFVRQATVAHAVYAPEVRHPVEVTAAQQEHLVQWLSKRLERPLKLPQLSALGYELVGGRLLPGADGARAQFMYQNAGGVRITLYLGAMKDVPVGQAATPGSPDRRETAFRFSTDGPVPGFYWVDQGFGYALSGKLPRDQLMLIAQAVHQQL